MWDLATIKWMNAHPKEWDALCALDAERKELLERLNCLSAAKQTAEVRLDDIKVEMREIKDSTKEENI